MSETYMSHPDSRSLNGFVVALTILGGSPNDVGMLEAEKLLGITCEEGSNLFLDGFWPKDLKLAYRAAKDEQERAKIGAKRIDYFIEKGC